MIKLCSQIIKVKDPLFLTSINWLLGYVFENYFLSHLYHRLQMSYIKAG